jgi:ABC-type antimicrobial peptide transport system permease subunit
VIGVTRNGTYVSFGEEPRAFAFLSVSQRYTPVQKLHVHTRAGVQAADMIAALRNEVASLDPDVALERPMPMSAAIGFMLFPQRFAAFVVGAFGLVGLCLAGVGVYGVLSQYVLQRWRELGIRVALGADTRKLLRLVLGRGAFLAVVGCAAGLLLASALTRLLQGFLYGINPLDPVTFAAVPVLLAAVALLATWFPARRALSVDPMQALRQE